MFIVTVFSLESGVDLDPSASVVSNGNSIYETAFDMKRFTVFHMGVDSYHSKGI